MRLHSGQVTEIQLDSSRKLAAWISCTPEALPDPGQYLMAKDSDSILPTPLFLGTRADNGFLTAPAIPTGWTPGTRLQLHGPLGKGFHIPASALKLAFVALTDTSARLLSLIHSALQEDRSVALFTDTPLPPLPSDLEAHPLSALPEFIFWADFLAVDLSLQDLPRLRQTFGLTPQEHLTCQGQALVFAPMPCGTLADCGVCALKVRNTWKLVCKDGPVFNLKDLEW
jgi:NAD(P)H-flavin reductase